MTPPVDIKGAAVLPAVLTPEMLARRWHMTPAGIRRLCERGALEYFRAGKLYLIRGDVVRDH